MMDDDLILEEPATPPVQRAAPRGPRDPADLRRPKASARRAFGERAGLRDEDLTRFVDETEGRSERETRAAVLDALVTVQDRTSSFPIHPSQTDDNGPGGLLDAMSEAVVARLRPGSEVSQRAAQYVGLDLPDMGRELLRAANVSTMGMTRNRVVETALATRGYHTTSDFAVVLGNATNTILRRDYAAQLAPIRAVFGRTVVEDFREIKRAQIGHFPDLLPTNEHGEFRRGTVVEEGANGYRLGTFGRIFGATRQLIINDQLGAIDRIIRTATTAATDLENTILIGLIETPSDMATGPVFSEAHGNLAAAGSALSVTSVDTAIRAVEKQKGIDGRLIYQRAEYLVVPTELRIAARRLLAEIQASRTEDVNPLAGELKLIVEPRLTDPKAWYVVAAPSAHEGVEYALLAGNEAPFTDSRSGFDVDGIEFKVRHDFGGGWIDHRGWYKNPGV